MKPYLSEAWLVRDELIDATAPLQEAGHSVNVSARFDPTETWILVRVTVDGLPVVIDRMPGGLVHETFDQIAGLLARNAETLRSLRTPVPVPVCPVPSLPRFLADGAVAV